MPIGKNIPARIEKKSRSHSLLLLTVYSRLSTEKPSEKFVPEKFTKRVILEGWVQLRHGITRGDYFDGRDIDYSGFYGFGNPSECLL
jgi:hypothetical protein